MPLGEDLSRHILEVAALHR